MYIYILICTLYVSPRPWGTSNGVLRMSSKVYFCMLQFDDANVGPSQFTIMTDRTQGGASLNNGQLEIMVRSEYKVVLALSVYAREGCISCLSLSVHVGFQRALRFLTIERGAHLKKITI